MPKVREKRVVHFIYTVPRGGIFYRILNRLLVKLNFSPLYRWGWNPLIPWVRPIRAPHSISFNFLTVLKKNYEVRYYSMYEHGVAKVGENDIIIAQPAPVLPDNPPRLIDKQAITYRTFDSYPHNKKIIIMPYSGDEIYTSWWKDFVKEYGDNCLFFSGQIWFDQWDKSPFKDFAIKNLGRLNMGIDLEDYKFVKDKFNPCGNRGYLYVGHASWYKNTKMLELIAEKMPEYTFGHVGGGSIKGWKKIANFAKLDSDFVSRLAKEYDFFVNVSSGDPQVTTVLEMSALGFLVACTPESGYNWTSLIELDTKDLEYNCRQLEGLQFLTEDEIKKLVASNRAILKKDYNWEKVSHDFIEFVKNI